MTRGELRARVLHGLNEDPAAPVFFSTTEVNEVLDEAAEVLAEEAFAIRRTAYLPLIEGTGFYAVRSVAPDVMWPYRVWNPSRMERLRVVSLSQLEDRHELWDTVTGVPEAWFPVSWDLFGIWPRPVQGGGLLRVDYYAWPRALGDDSDRPEFLETEHDALVLYGLYDGAAKRWDDATALAAWRQFQQALPGARDREGLGGASARPFQRPMTGDVPGFPTGTRH